MNIHPNKLTPHPYNEKIYGQESIDILKERIAVSKWIKPIVVTSNHVIISGHRRWRVAMELGLEVPIEYKVFANEIDELEALLLENESREKTPEQRVREAEYWRKIETERANHRKSEAVKARWENIDTENFPYLSSVPGETRDKVADKVGFGSGRTYEKAAAVVAIADKLKVDGQAEQAQVLLHTLNTKSVHRAYQEVKRQEKQEERQHTYEHTIVDRDDCRIQHCPVAEFHFHIDPESIDAIITDPPYPREYLSVYQDLADFAAYALKPGGSLIAMVGQSYLPEIIVMLSTRLAYHWTLAYLTPGGQAPQMWQKNVLTFWKPLLWFVKGKYAGDWVGDVCKSQINDKQHHHWGQSESGMADILERLTLPGQTICDPFVGGGTTAIVALDMRRRFIGCDVDMACVEKTTRRIQEVHCERV